MSLLVQFLLRLTFGLALGMAITSPKLVTSGYFRNHLYVTLGLAALAALLSISAAESVLWYAVAAAVCSYLGSIYWLFEKSGPGKLMLAIVAGAALVGAGKDWQRQTDEKATLTFLSKYDLGEFAEQSNSLLPTEEPTDKQAKAMIREITNGYDWPLMASVSSGLLLGFTMAAMLLGHWYLNTPGMQLVPLQRLLLAMAAAVGLQLLLSSVGLYREATLRDELETQWLLFIALRWTFGLIGVATMTWMAWQTLKIPNTQSATGILYVAVIGTFVGETMALLLSTESLFPL